MIHTLNAKETSVLRSSIKYKLLCACCILGILLVWTGSIIVALCLVKPNPVLHSRTTTPRLDAHIIHPHRKILSCGSSSSEAEALGCTYDPLTACWLHNDCPRDGTEEYLAWRGGNHVQYWYDREATERIPDLDTMAQNNGEYYWSNAYDHLVHCAFMLVRSHNVLASGRRLDSLTGDTSHANHCATYLLRYAESPPETLLNITTRGVVGFLSC